MFSNVDLALNDFLARIGAFVNKHESARNPFKEQLSEINELIALLEGKLKSTDPTQEEYYFLRKQSSILKMYRIRIERSGYYEHRKKELEEEARVKLIQESELKQLKMDNELLIRIEAEQSKHIFAEMRESVKKIKLMAEPSIDKLIEQSRNAFDSRQIEHARIREQIKSEDENFAELNRRVLDSKLFDKLLAKHPGLKREELEKAWDQYWSFDPELRKQKKVNQFAESLGVAAEEVSEAVRNEDLSDTVSAMQESKIRRAGLMAQDAKLVAKDIEDLLAISKQLASMPEGPEKNDLSTHYEYMLSQVSPEVFQRYLDTKAREIDLRRAELNVTLKSVYDPEDQAKSQKRRKEIGQELAEELSLLQEDVAGVVAMAKQKLQSNPEQFGSVEETQLKIQEKARELQETFPQVLEEIQTREKTRREQAEKEMEDLNLRMAALRKPGEKPLSELEVRKEILRYFLENNPNPSKEELENIREEINKVIEEAELDEDDKLVNGLEKLHVAIDKVIEAIESESAEDLQESLAHLKSLTVAEEGSEVEETPAVLTPGDEELAPTPEPNKGGAPEPQQGVHRSIPTMFRIARILGITESDPQKLIKAVQEKLKGFNDAYIEQIIGTDGKKERERLTIGEDDTDEIRSKKEAYISLRVRLEGELPVPLHEVNFDDKASVDKAVDEMLATLDDEIKKAKLTEEERSAVRDFLKMRLMLGAYRSVDARDFDIAGLLESLKEQEKVHQRVSGKGPLDPEIVTAMETGARLPSKLAKRLSAQSFELQKGVRAYITQNGKPAVIINEFNKKNVLAAIAHLRHARTLECRNIPRRHRMLVETEGCRQWKQVSFDGELGPYSEHMPKNPGSWAAWYMNIEKAESGQKAKGRQSWMKGHPSTQKFVADVIDGDQATLRSFWEDVSLHGTQEMQKKIYGQMSSQQRESLKAHLNTVPSDETPLAEVRRKKQLEAFKRSANPGEPPKPPSEKQSPKPR